MVTRPLSVTNLKDATLVTEVVGPTSPLTPLSTSSRRLSAGCFPSKKSALSMSTSSNATFPPAAFMSAAANFAARRISLKWDRLSNTESPMRNGSSSSPPQAASPRPSRAAATTERIVVLIASPAPDSVANLVLSVVRFMVGPPGRVNARKVFARHALFILFIASNHKMFIFPPAGRTAVFGSLLIWTFPKGPFGPFVGGN